MYRVVCHEGGFPPPPAHNYLLLLANVRSVIISGLQRTCGYRRLSNSWSHTATAWVSLFSYSGLLDPKGTVPFSPTGLHGAMWCFNPTCGPEVNIWPGCTAGRTQAYSHCTICKVLAHIASSDPPSSLESEAERGLGFTEDEIMSEEAMTWML